MTQEEKELLLKKLNNLLEQDEDIEVNSVNELVEKFNDYGKET